MEKLASLYKYSNSMIASRLLSHLDGVRETGRDRWIAKCPAHDDKSPSLAIREVDERVLIHCFSGCSTYEIVSAMGLELSDLFPEKINTGNKRYTKPFPAADILRCLTSEITFLVICASDLAKEEKLNQEDKDRLLISASRFRSALTAGGVS